VDIIVTNGAPAALAAKQATATIPIVAIAVSDPVGLRLVASLSRPGGNITGLASLAPELAAKRLALLKETLPRSLG
jgi:putative ABC transport system substrate-binding protein